MEAQSNEHLRLVGFVIVTDRRPNTYHLSSLLPQQSLSHICPSAAAPSPATTHRRWAPPGPGSLLPSSASNGHGAPTLTLPHRRAPAPAPAATSSSPGSSSPSATSRRASSSRATSLPPPPLLLPAEEDYGAVRGAARVPPRWWWWRRTAGTRSSGPWRRRSRPGAPPPCWSSTPRAAACAPRCRASFARSRTVPVVPLASCSPTPRTTGGSLR